MATITVENTIHAPVERVWKLWTLPEHIVRWAYASDDWEAQQAENDVREGGKFKTVMAARDGGESFDFTGTYKSVIPHERIEYVIDDGRKVVVQFESMDGKTKLIESFEPENINPADMQRAGWQAILDNFKKYVERKRKNR